MTFFSTKSSMLGLSVFVPHHVSWSANGVHDTWLLVSLTVIPANSVQMYNLQNNLQQCNR